MDRRQRYGKAAPLSIKSAYDLSPKRPNILMFCGTMVGARGFEPASAKASARQASDPSIPNQGITTTFWNDLRFFESG